MAGLPLLPRWVPGSPGATAAAQAFMGSVDKEVADDREVASERWYRVLRSSSPVVVLLDIAAMHDMHFVAVRIAQVGAVVTVAIVWARAGLAVVDSSS